MLQDFLIEALVRILFVPSDEVFMRDEAIAVVEILAWTFWILSMMKRNSENNGVEYVQTRWR